MHDLPIGRHSSIDLFNAVRRARSEVGIVGRWFERRLLARQVLEIQSLLAIMASLDKVELSELAVVVHHAKRGMQQSGNEAMRPFELVAARPATVLTTVRLVEDFRKKGNETAASGFMVWAHTFRAALRPELLPLARQMWRELARGFPDVEAAASRLSVKLQTPFESVGADEFPAGFDPRF